jgi:tRNA(Ile)-lysidine synthase
LPGMKNICVAISGGCDSTALFYVLSALQKRLGIARLGIAHVNHRLRGTESDADAAFVKEISDRAGAPFYEKVLGPRPPGLGMEEWARGERYAFFNVLRTTEGFDYIATGHTANDQAETVIMRIMRGSGLKGLCAIAPIREDRVIRPFLQISKASLVAWLLETRKTFREDSTNKDIAYHRNRVRHRLLPALLTSQPLAAELLPRIADAAFLAWQSLSGLINQWIASYVASKSDERFEIYKTGLVDFPFAQEAVAEVLRRRGIPFEQRHIEEIVSHAPRRSGLFLLPGGWRYCCEEGKMTFSKAGAGNPEGAHPCAHVHDFSIGSTIVCENANMSIENVFFPINQGEPLQYCPDNMTAFLDAATIKGPIEFRSLKRDDLFRPLGCDELRNVKEFLKKRKKLPPATIVVAEKSGEIIWIPGVQINHHFRVTPQTTVIIKFSCKYIR